MRISMGRGPAQDSPPARLVCRVVQAMSRRRRRGRRTRAPKVRRNRRKLRAPLRVKPVTGPWPRHTQRGPPPFPTRASHRWSGTRAAHWSSGTRTAACGWWSPPDLSPERWCRVG